MVACRTTSWIRCVTATVHDVLEAWPHDLEMEARDRAQGAMPHLGFEMTSTIPSSIGLPWLRGVE